MSGHSGKEEPGSGPGDGTTAGVGALARFDVRTSSSATVIVTASTWGSMETEVKWSVDQSAWHSFPTSLLAFEDSTFEAVSVAGYPFVGLDVITSDATAVGLTIELWGQA